MSNDIRTQLRTYFGRMLGQKTAETDFSDADLLFTSGKLDSLDATETAMFLEENYAINFAKSGFDLTYIDSIDTIVALIEKSGKSGQNDHGEGP